MGKRDQRGPSHPSVTLRSGRPAIRCHKRAPGWSVTRADRQPHPHWANLAPGWVAHRDRHGRQALHRFRCGLAPRKCTTGMHVPMPVHRLLKQGYSIPRASITSPTIEDHRDTRLGRCFLAEAHAVGSGVDHLGDTAPRTATATVLALSR